MKLQEELSALFQRDLDRLRAELDAYESDDSLWVVKGDIKNAAGNLMLHICGNLKHYIGAVLGGTGYMRHRDLEFSGKATRAELETNIAETKDIVVAFLADVPDAILSETYPRQSFDYTMSNSHFIIHLYGHLHYHLGQINYHRRLT